MRALHVRRLLALTVVLTLPLFVSCGDDETPHNPVPGGGENLLLGTWWALSVTIVGQPAAGDAVVDDGLEFSINFNDIGEYAVLVNNDDPADPWMCEDTATCEWWGLYTIRDNTVTFDEGTTDEMAATFAVANDTLTATIDGRFRLVAEKT